MDRKQQQADLMMKLGALVAPVEEASAFPDRFNPQSRASMLAKYFAGQHPFAEMARLFCQGEAGHEYRIQYNRIFQSLRDLARAIEAHPDDNEQIIQAVARAKSLASGAIATVPVEGGGVILEAQSPFTVYCKLKDICVTALQSITWTDRYFDASVFYRYLREVRIEVAVTLVILDPSKITGAKDRARHSDFMDVSRLFAAEKGPDRYRLVTHADFHDRWLRCDGQFYALGGSVKDAGQKSDFAIARLDASAPNVSKVDALVSSSAELFGPGNPSHP